MEVSKTGRTEDTNGNFKVGYGANRNCMEHMALDYS